MWTPSGVVRVRNSSLRPLEGAVGHFVQAVGEMVFKFVSLVTSRTGVYYGAVSHTFFNIAE